MFLFTHEKLFNVNTVKAQRNTSFNSPAWLGKVENLNFITESCIRLKDGCHAWVLILILIDSCWLPFIETEILGQLINHEYANYTI